ncbi:MAG: hypoxanthine phosphoribosyltransferase [Ignavibacteriales bacterium]|nr:hypoxanthine phosphoribosyltransferase [Ignavibacteriales bacterium]
MRQTETSIIKVGNEEFEILLHENEIQKRVKELAQKITENYHGKLPIIIGILNGSFIFMSDLVKNLSIQCEIDFFKLSSYGDEKISSGKVTMLKELNADINDRNILLVEDIVDTGLSISYIKNILESSNPASVKIATLLLKPESLKHNLDIEYIGFEIPNRFVIGYGLDYAQKYRNLRSIYALKQ